MGWQDAPIVGRPQAPPNQPRAAWESAPVVAAPPAPGKRPTSEVLGFMEGLEAPMRHIRQLDPLAHVDLPGSRRREVDAEANKGVKDYFATREQTRRPGEIGKVVGSLVGTAPAAVITRDPWLLGGMQGALTTESDDPTQIAMNAAWGAVMSKVTGVATDKAIDVLKPVVSPAVEAMKRAGVRMTPGQIKGGKALIREDKAMSRPIVGEAIAADRSRFVDDVNRGAVNRVMFPLGLQLPKGVATGHDAVAWMQGEIGKAYDSILPKLSLQADPRLAVGLRRAQQVVETLSPEQQATFFNNLRPNMKFQEQGGVMSGRQLTRSVRELKRAAAGFGRSNSEAERQIGAALGHVVDGMDSALMAQNPEFAPMLKAANAAYRDSQVVNRAAAAADDGVAGTGQFKTASRAVDRSKGKRMTAAGRGPMQDYTSAARAVTGKTPDSGTAGRLMDGKWLPTIRGAADRVGYEADKALTGLKFAPRPAVVKKLAGLLEQYQPVITAAGGPVLGGLLAGLLSDD